MLYTILATIYEFLSQFLPFFLLLMLFRRRRGNDAAAFSKGSYVLPVIFALYIIAVFYVTGAGTVYDGMRAHWEDMQKRVNLLPFSREIDIQGYLLNIVMFVPLGFLVSLIWKPMGKAFQIAATGLGLSLLIELSQLLSYRGTDVDDLIMNTLGAVLGLLVYRVWNAVTKSKYQPESLDIMELPAYILALYLGRCLLFNRLGLIHLIYGY